MSLSASELSWASYEKWQESARLNKYNLYEIPTVVTLFETFLNDIKYPRCIKDTKFIDLVSLHENKKVAQWIFADDGARYTHWVSHLKDDQLEDNDPYELEHYRHILLHCWDFHRHSSSNEAELRMGTDSLISSAFALRLKGKHHLRAERDLFLPAPPWTAKADVIMSMVLPFDWVQFLMDLQNPVFSSEANWEPNRVVTFAVEAKSKDRVSASRQLAMYLCSAQHQRRALGFEDGPLFGATVVGSILTIYISTWGNDKVDVAPGMPNFKLDNVSGFIKCYMFLCRVADHSANEVENMIRKWGTKGGKEDIKQRNRDATRSPWRLQSKPEVLRTSRKRRHPSDDRSLGDSGSREMEDGVEDEPALNAAHSLVRANLRALEEYDKSHMNLVGLPPSKDIRSWARNSSGGGVDAS
ncbi:hypothetical protein B0F90DRAFT_1927532 [Multifurca ochricompacta]|uniref:Uncharacterized protein n=1 Tax=Multifurca ochricompacta TaxID=376703 RepID=A0AAD4LYQ7_9AGAM|nr:hypothetical protein B0F90DRAFT_1927532 [Multifurca ochricompacta]